MEQQKRMIDVIVPVYNVEDYLKECLDSLIKQTIPIHIIMVNDGSTDGSAIIAKQYALNYSNMITYIEQENAGLSAARNKGLMTSQAEYIAFMDSDDWVSEDYYEQLLKTIQQTDADIVCSDIMYAFENGKRNKKAAHNLPVEVNQTVIEKIDESYKQYMISIFPMAQNKLWKSSLIKEKFSFLSGKQYEDLDFFYRIYPSTKKIAFTDKGGFYYRQRSGSIVKTANNRIRDIMDIFNNIIAYYQVNGLYEMYHEEIAYLLIRNCLVASSKRLAYSRNYNFIRTNLNILFTFVNDTIPQWRSNYYIRTFSIRHIFIKTFSKKTLTSHTILLLIISIFLKK